MELKRVGTRAKADHNWSLIRRRYGLEERKQNDSQEQRQEQQTREELSERVGWIVDKPGA